MKPAVFDYLMIQYEALPEAIKAKFTYEDYRNMGDYGREMLVQQETEPEYTE